MEAFIDRPDDSSSITGGGGGLSRGAVVGDDVNSSAPLGIHVLFFVMF